MITLSELQNKAVESLVSFFRGETSYSRAILNGAAGTGKSTVTAEILKKLREHFADDQIFLCAPSHTAKDVLRKMIREKLDVNWRVSTIQGWANTKSFLVYNEDLTKVTNGFKPGVGLSTQPPVAIADEASMVGNDIYQNVISTLQGFDTRILWVGDSMQLMPVKEDKSPVFDNITDEDLVVTLTEVFRSKGSLLDKITKIRTENASIIKLFERKALMEAASYVATSNKRDIALMTSNSKVANFNAMVRAAGNRTEVAEVGEKIIFKSMGLEVYPSNLYTITDRMPKVIDLGNKKFEIIHVTLDNEYKAYIVPQGIYAELEATLAYTCKNLENEGKEGRQQAKILRMMFPEWQYGYAMTVHRSQGQTMDTVFLDPGIDGWPLHGLKYVAASRASENCYIVGG